jgi:hypothetical protein
VKLGPWRPDLTPFGHDGLTMARNVFPTLAGYEPVKAYSAVTVALAETWNGGGAFKASDGTVALLAGTSANLYKYTDPTWTGTAAGAYSNRWQFAQFGDLVICCMGAAPKKHTLTSGVTASLGGSPPNARYVTTVKDFVVMSGVDSANSTVYWSAINNAEGWTPGTAQSDTQVLPDGGAVTGLAGGEYLLVFQRNAIWRGQYVGPPFIFQFDKISDGIGCTSPYSIVQIGRTVYFWSQRGFMSITDGSIDPFGAQQVDKTFIEQYSTAEIESNIWSTADPVKKQVVWAMPQRLWCYNWELKRWTDIEESVFGVFQGLTSNYTLEQIAALYPAIEDVPYPLDDPRWQGGQPFLGIAANDKTLGSFGSSTTLRSEITTAYQEPVPGRDTRIRSVRLESDVTSNMVVSLNCRDRMGDSDTQAISGAVRANGDAPIRARGRYIQPTMVFAEGADWTFVNSFEIIGAAGGARQ